MIVTEEAHLFYGDEAGIDAVGRTLPLDRMGTPEEVADVVLFCASPLARFCWVRAQQKCFRVRRCHACVDIAVGNGRIDHREGRCAVEVCPRDEVVSVRLGRPRGRCEVEVEPRTTTEAAVG